jgi:hypothetical protein
LRKEGEEKEVKKRTALIFYSWRFSLLLSVFPLDHKARERPTDGRRIVFERRAFNFLRIILVRKEGRVEGICDIQCSRPLSSQSLVRGEKVGSVNGLSSRYVDREKRAET